jgi:hypothetical protein
MTQPSSGDRRELVVAVLLFGFGVLTTIVAPHQLAAVFLIDDVRIVSPVVIPIAYWLGLAMLAFYLAGADRTGRPRAFSSVVLAGFATHALLLLAVSVARVTDQGAYSTTFYWMYARVFCAAVLAAASGWLALATERRITVTYLALPVALSVVVLAVQVFRYDPVFAIAGLVIGGAAAVAYDTRDSWRAVVTNERVFLVLVFMIALALRLLYTRRVMTNPDYIETGADAVFYDRIAWSIARGQGIDNPDYPMYILGYARFVALVYWIFGHSYFALCAIQSAIGACVPVGIYYLAKPTFGVPVAVATAVLTAVSFPLVFAAAAIGHQAIDVATTLGLVGLLALAVTRPFESPWQWLAVGLAFGLAIAVRETNVVFLAFVFVWLAYALRGRTMRVGPLAAAACMTLGLTVALAPLVARMVVSPEARFALRDHFDRLFEGKLDPAGLRGAGVTTPLTDPAGALEQVRRRPLYVLATEARVARHYFAVQFFSQPYGEFDLLTLRKGSDYYFGMFAWAYLFSLIGLAIGCTRVLDGDRVSPVIALMLGLLVFRTLPHLVLDSSYRHRVPIEPFLILFCQVGFWGVVSKGMERA